MCFYLMQPTVNALSAAAAATTSAGLADRVASVVASSGMVRLRQLFVVCCPSVNLKIHRELNLQLFYVLATSICFV